MSVKAQVQELISQVEQGQFLEAFEKFYAPDVVMQENNHPPTVGKTANREREEAFVRGIAELHESRAESFVVEGDQAVIHWILDFTDTDGTRYRSDQLAYQTWRDNHIIRERFYYDAAVPEAEKAAERLAA